MEEQSPQGSRVGRYRRRLTGERREHRTVIKHTDEEWARVNALAAAQGISVPMLYERAVRTGDVSAAAELSRLVVEVHVVQRVMAGAARNLNQIARATNAGAEYAPAQVLAAAQAIERQAERVQQLLAAVPGGDYLRG